MFIPNPNFSISDPGLKRFRIPDLDPYQRLQEFFTQKVVSKLSEIWSGMFIPKPVSLWKRVFWACFRENWVYKFGHWILTFLPIPSCQWIKSREKRSNKIKEVPEDIPPVYGAEYKPKQAQEDVHPAHGSVEGQQGPVSHRQVACRSDRFRGTHQTTAKSSWPNLYHQRGQCILYSVVYNPTPLPDISLLGS